MTGEGVAVLGGRALDRPLALDRGSDGKDTDTDTSMAGQVVQMREAAMSNSEEDSD